MKLNREKDRFFFSKIKAGDYTYDPDTGYIYNRYGKKLGTKNSRGYITLGSLNNGKLMIIQAHRVAWMIKNQNIIPQGLVPNHKDGDKTNNKWSNLELVTDGENKKHAYTTCLHKGPVGDKNVNSIFTNEEVRFYRKNFRLGLITRKFIQKKHKCSRHAVGDMLSGKRYKDA